MHKLTKKLFVGLVCLLIVACCAMLAYAAEIVYQEGHSLQITNSGGSLTVTDGAISGSVEGSTYLGFISKTGTGTYTLTNKSSEYTIILTGKLTASSAGSNGKITINNGTSQTASNYTYDQPITLAPGAKFTIKIESAKGEGNTTSFTYKPTIAVLKYCDVTFTAGGSDYSVNGTAFSSMENKTVSISTDATASIQVPSYTANGTEYVCIGFADQNNKLVAATDTTGATIFQPTDDCTLHPVYIPKPDKVPFQVKDGETLYSYYTWESAFLKGNGGLVILADNYTLPATLPTTAGAISWQYVQTVNGKLNYIVPKLSTLLIPFNADNTLITDNMMSNVHSPYTEYPARTQYRQMTMPSGTNIIVQSGSTLCVGSRSHMMMVGQTGPYGAIYMDEGSNITVQSGGKLYTWGYIMYGQGAGGTVSVESGGIVYENTTVMDYTGNAGTAINIFNSGVMPVRSYGFINVEVPMTLYYGSQHHGFYHLHGDTAGDHGGFVYAFGAEVLKVPGFLGFGETDVYPLFHMTQSGGSITKAYKDGRQIVEFNGNVDIRSLSLTVKYLISVTLDSSKTSGVVLPGCFDVHIKSGTITLYDNVIFGEGTRCHIHKGATVNANGKNLYFLGADDPSFNGVVDPNKYDVHGNNFLNVNTNATLDINGTLIASGGFYASANVASITSSQKSGVVQVTTQSNAVTLTLKKDIGETATLTIQPAFLQHGDGSRMQSTVDTFTYHAVLDRWLGSGHTVDVWNVTTAPTCTAKGERTGNCILCGLVITEEMAATGHSMATATCTEPSTCRICGYTEGNPTGHKWTEENHKCPNVQLCENGCGSQRATTDLGHTAGAAATCTTAQVCTNCGAEMAPALGHTDTDGDHLCDRDGCDERSPCVDANLDHICDIAGCGGYVGVHEDLNLDHACDYGCAEAIGACIDNNKDHQCDYGCGKQFGQHLDTNKDHQCEYGCSTKIGICWDGGDNPICCDADADLRCDYCGQLFNFVASNIRLGNNLDMLFAFPNFAPDANLEGCYVKIVRPGANDLIIPFSKWKSTTVNGMACYYVIYSGFAAKDMCDSVKATVYASDGSALSAEWNDSVRAYCDRMLLKYNTSSHPKLVTLIADMLNYGAACQMFFGYNTTNLANANLSVQGTTGAISWSQNYYKPVNSYFFGDNLIADSKSQFVVGFTPKAYGKEFTYTLTNHWGIKVERTVTAGSLKLGSDPNRGQFYYHGLLNLRIADARLPFTVTIDGNSWTDSVESYCRRMTEAANAVLNDGSATADAKTNATKTIEVMTAFMRFSDAAKAYLHSTEVVD